MRELAVQYKNGSGVWQDDPGAVACAGSRVSARVERKGEGEAIGLPRSFTILDAEESEGILRDAVNHIVDSGLLGQIHDISLGYTVVYHVEIALLFLTLAALGPLVRIGTTTHPDQGQPGLRLTEFPT